MLESIIASIIATGIIEISLRLLKRKTLFILLPNFFKKITTFIIRRKSRSEDAIITFMNYLEHDQQKEGAFRGQFGLGSRITEEKRFQSIEDINKIHESKPRLFLTYWPTLLLTKYYQIPKAKLLVENVKHGIENLLVDCWIPVVIGATHFTDPTGVRQLQKIISIRHTIRAAQIVLIIEPTSYIPKTILGRMLENSSNMQAENGGWRQCKEEFTEPDLWGSAYAIGFLNSCILGAKELNLNTSIISKAENKLNKTIDWLDIQWSKNKFKYGKVPTEENSPHIFVEVFYALQRYRPKLLTNILSHINSFLDDFSHPTEKYIKKLKIVGSFSAASRIAYANFLARSEFPASEKNWRLLRDYTLHQIKSGYNCVEAATMLDMLLSDADTYNKMFNADAHAGR